MVSKTNDSEVDKSRLSNRLSSRWIVLLIVFFTLIFRSLFGLLNGFVNGFDQLYIYTLGLKYFTSGAWPFFGPDVVYTNSQIPGALQSLWVAVPLWVFPIPESPFFFYLLAVMGSLSFLAWYASRLELVLPTPVIWIWVLTTPWSLLFGSTIINPGYVMIYAIFFMVMLYEQARLSVLDIIPKQLRFFLMGFCTTQIMQLHLSWVMLVPLMSLALLLEFIENKTKTIFRAGGMMFLGLLMGGITLYPTIIEYGIYSSGGAEKNIVFNTSNINDFLKTLFNFLYFPSYQVITLFNPYVITFTGVEERVLTLWNQHWWTIPVFIIPFAFGLIQIVLYLLGFFTLVPLRNTRWLVIRLLVFGTMLLTWVGFFFNDSGNSAHKYFMFFPLTVLYSLYVLEWAWRKKYFHWIYGVSLFFMLFSHAIIAVDAYHDQNNPYHFYKVRDKIAAAIEKKDYTIYSTTRYDEYTNQLLNGEGANTLRQPRPGY